MLIEEIHTVNITDELREKVIELRAIEDISQQKLADMTGVTKSKINQFESGRSKEIGSGFLLGVAQHPDLIKYLAWLVGIEATPPINPVFTDQDIDKMSVDQLELLQRLIDSALGDSQ